MASKPAGEAILIRSLEILRQAYQKLAAISPVASVRERLSEDAVRLQVESLLETVSIHGRIANDHIAQLLRSQQTPVLVLPSHLAEFYERDYLPHREELESLFCESFLGSFEIDLSSSAVAVRSRPVEETIVWSVERMRERAEDSGWEFGDQDAFDDVNKILASHWFAPDAWLENQADLKPVLADRLPNEFPAHVRVRLAEIYRSFIVGNWFALVALARSLLEYCLVDRATNFKVLVADERKRRRSLAEIAADYSEHLPEIALGLDEVRELGNRVLHPSKAYDVVQFPLVMRKDALRCVEHLRQILAVLYSKGPR